MEVVRQLRIILRSLGRRPALSVAVVLTLALGIGASAAVYSVLQTVLLTPLPYADPDELVFVWQEDQARKTTREGASIPDYFDWKEAQESFRGLGAFQFWEGDLSDSVSEPEHVVAVQATPDLLPLLGVAPAAGRGFTAEEGRPGGPNVALLGYRFWQRRYGGDRSVIGRTLSLNGQSHEVVGVLPPDFETPVEWDESLWTPLQASPGGGDRAVHNLRVVGRLAPGVSATRAQEEMRSIMRGLEAEHPDTNQDRTATVASLYDDFVGDVRPTLWLLTGAVLLVLLIVFSNVSNLLLVRALEGRQEMAIRTALGGGKIGLLSRFLAESVVLALVGGVAALVLAWWILRTLTALAPADVPRFDAIDFGGGVVLFAFGLSLLAGIACSLLPMLFSRRLDVQGHLKQGGRTLGEGKTSLSGILVVVAVAMAVVLTVEAALLLASFDRLRAIDLGFEPDGAAKVTFTLPDSRYPFPGMENYPKWPEVESFYRTLQERIEAIPGVESAGLAFHHPLDPGWETPVTLEGSDPEVGRETPEANFRPVTAGYFRAAGISVLQGRDLAPTDDADHPPVAVVNSSFAESYGGNVIGQRLNLWGVSREIVGVVGDVRFNGPDQPAEPSVYTPLFQTPFLLISAVARTSGDPESLIAPLRQAVRSVDPEIAIYGDETLEQTAVGIIGEPRFRMLLLMLFAGTALCVALIGVYGLVARSVAQRTHEIGLRMALGSRRQDIFVLILSWGFKRLVLGIVIGWLGAFVFARLLANVLYGVGATHLPVFLGVAVAVLVTGLVACLLPSLSASRLDPLQAFRGE